jgi:hypothetical protein
LKQEMSSHVKFCSHFYMDQVIHADLFSHENYFETKVTKNKQVRRESIYYCSLSGWLVFKNCVTLSTLHVCFHPFLSFSLAGVHHYCISIGFLLRKILWPRRTDSPKRRQGLFSDELHRHVQFVDIEWQNTLAPRGAEVLRDEERFQHGELGQPLKSRRQGGDNRPIRGWSPFLAANSNLIEDS